MALTTDAAQLAFTRAGIKKRFSPNTILMSVQHLPASYLALENAAFFMRFEKDTGRQIPIRP